MGFVLELLLDAFVLLLLSKLMTTVHVKSYSTAIAVAFVVALFNATIGAIIRFPLNLITLFLLSFVVRLFVTALMLKFADNFFKDFQIDGFRPALIIALVMAVTGTLFSGFIY